MGVPPEQVLAPPQFPVSGSLLLGITQQCTLCNGNCAVCKFQCAGLCIVFKDHAKASSSRLVHCNAKVQSVFYTGFVSSSIISVSYEFF